jgi:tetrapyrrole methylase family protein/MazG family protein
VKRFRYIEEQAERSGRKLNDLTLEEMDRWWEEAKTAEAGEIGK